MQIFADLGTFSFHFFQFTVRLSSNSDAFTYGGFFLSRGAHMQLSFRTALRYCSEQKQDEFKNVVAISSGALK